MSQVLFQKQLSSFGIQQLMKRDENPKQGWFSWGRSNTPNSSSRLRGKASEPILSPKRMDTSPKPLSRSQSPANEAPKIYAKSLRLTSDQLLSLDLKDGVNQIQFSVVSGFQGRAVCRAKIFLWDWDSKVVISDVDGTITKSDVLGHVFTMGKSKNQLTLSWKGLDSCWCS